MAAAALTTAATAETIATAESITAAKAVATAEAIAARGAGRRFSRGGIYAVHRHHLKAALGVG